MYFVSGREKGGIFCMHMFVASQGVHLCGLHTFFLNFYNNISPTFYLIVAPGEKWFQGKLQFMLSQRGKPLLVHNGENFGIQYVRKDKKYWQCNLSRKYNCKARVTTTDNDDIIVTNAEHCHTEIRAHLKKEYKLNKMNQLAALHTMQQQQQQQEQEKRYQEEHEKRIKEEQHRIIEHLKNFSNHNNNNNNSNAN